MSASPIVAALGRVGAILSAHEDVVAGRVSAPEPPAWCARRGWDGWLAGLDEDTLRAAERDPATILAAAPGAPDSLRELSRAVTDACAIRPLAPAPAEEIPSASASKRAQVAALRRLLRSAGAEARRVIDFGAGRGHLTRALAAALDLPAIGLERRAEVVEAARALGEPEGVRFETRDATRGLRLEASDLLVGLHACGALGDALIRAAADRDSRALLVPCCPQKIPVEVRAPISAEGERLGLSLSRSRLGLANLGALGEGPVSADEANALRRTRYALRLLLRGAGIEVGPGEESRGLNRRRFRHPLAEVAKAAFARRGLAPPGPAAIREAEARAAREHPLVRRLGLPRRLLARPLEVAIALDRAALLAERHRRVEVVEAFPRAVSPRNLAVVAL